MRLGLKVRAVSLIRTLRLALSNIARFSRRLPLPERSLVLDLSFVIGSGLWILGSVGLLQNGSPMGDDALFHVANIRNLASALPNFAWDPHTFSGYSPTVGYAWTAWLPPAFLILLGGDPASVFHVSFLANFLLLGLSVYYFARKIEAHRIVAIALPVLIWSTNTYWNISVWGGAYGRVFSLAFMFTALALTYQQATRAERGDGALWRYLLVLSLWIMVFLSDIFMAMIGFAVAFLFIVFSAGWHFRRGLARLAGTFLPVFALTAWNLVPLAIHVWAVSPLRNDLTPNPVSQLFLTAPAFTSSLSPVYIPAIAALAIFLAVAKKRGLPTNWTPVALGALTLSLSILSLYLLMMGWIPLVWPYLPRLMATYDSNVYLSFTFVMMLASLFVVLSRTAFSRFTTRFAVIFLVAIMINASLAVPTVRPADWNPLTNALRNSLQENASFSNDFRVSLDGRVLTRWFPYFYPDQQQTGGRLFSLDQNPFYQSWFQTEVFYKADLGTLNRVYLEDQPVKNVSQYIGGPDNFAETRYWLDWYGSRTIVLAPAFYPVDNTIAGYNDRSASFLTSTSLTSYGPLAFIKYNQPSPILTATNAPTVGFYSTGQDALNQYYTLLALLSYLGLSSKYVVPVNLSSLVDLDPKSFDLIATDYSTYSQDAVQLNNLQAQGMRILVLAPNYLSTTLRQGSAGAYNLVSLIPTIIKMNNMDLTLLATVPGGTLNPRPGDWKTGFTKNAGGMIVTGQDNITVSLNIPDTSSKAQFNLDDTLPSPAYLTSHLRTAFSVMTDTNVTIGQLFTAQNFTSNFVALDREVAPGTWVNLQAPFSNFTTWQDPNSRFAIADKFSIAITIPPGHSRATIQIRNVSLTVPSVAILQLSVPIPMSSDGFLHVAPLPSNSSIILSDLTGSSNGVREITGSEQGSTVIPLPEFTSEANRSFTRIIVTGTVSAQQFSVSLFQQPGWSSVRNNWITNENLNVPLVEGGFKGLVWKETHVNNWRVVGTDTAGRQLSLQYYSAGPGMIYIPLRGFPLTNMSMQYLIFTPTNVALIGLAASTIVILIAFRRRAYVIGVRKRNTSSLLTGLKG